MLKIDTQVRVKQNAYEGSDDPADFEVRGKTGVIDSIAIDYIAVKIGNGYYLLTADEIEEITEAREIEE